MALAARHELKYFISQGQYQILSRLLGQVLWPDEHADEQNEYHIRSLYFDTISDAALHEKVSGVADRNKYRIRFYNFSDRFIRMECKTKIDTYISKRSVPISRELCESNQARLDYKPREGGGSCFRITFAHPRKLS